MKKAIALILTVLFLLSAAACAKGSEAQKSTAPAKTAETEAKTVPSGTAENATTTETPVTTPETPTNMPDVPTETLTETPTNTPDMPTETPVRTVAATVYFEAQFRIELDLDTDGEVIGVRGVDDGGQALEEVEDYVGMTLERAARRIVFRASKLGYFETAEDYLLISFETTLPAEQQQALRKGATAGFEDGDVSGNPILQKLYRSPTVLMRAEKYGISPARAQYMTRLIGRRIGEREGKPEGEPYAEETLATLSLREMAKLARTMHIPYDYTFNFTLENAYAFGLAHAQVAPEDSELAAWASFIDVDASLPYYTALEIADAVWSFGFVYDGKAYTYRCNARTGELTCKNKGKAPTSESEVHALVEAYFLDLGETVISVFTFNDFEVNSYLYGECDDPHYLINAKTDEKGIYMLRINALTQEIEVIYLHPWTTEDGRAPKGRAHA